MLYVKIMQVTCSNNKNNNNIKTSEAQTFHDITSEG